MWLNYGLHTLTLGGTLNGNIYFNLTCHLRHGGDTIRLFGGYLAQLVSQ
jgi:hypothetical protein